MKKRRPRVIGLLDTAQKCAAVKVRFLVAPNQLEGLELLYFRRKK